MASTYSLNEMTDLRDWLTEQRSIDGYHIDSIVEFFRLSFGHTLFPESAWFGIHKSAVSLVVGGLYLAALDLTADNNDRGLWLLLDGEELSIRHGDLRPVKAARTSDIHLTWWHLWPLEGVGEMISDSRVWQAYSRATNTVLRVPIYGADRDDLMNKRGKERLSNILSRVGIISMPYADEAVNNVSRIPEGALRQVSVNVYERNPVARDRCIAHYGWKCSICGFDFERMYGPTGQGIIHVHHLRPLAEVGEEHRVDPVEDMRPVCPNCHTIVHRRNPPYSISEVKAMLDEGHGTDEG